MAEGGPKIEYHAGSIADFDTCEDLYLRGLLEPVDNCLRIIVEEAKAVREVAPLVIGETSIPRKAIETLPGCRAFWVEWKSYVAYTVGNESKIAIGNDDDSFEGRLFRHYATSQYLDFIKRHGWTFDDPDPRRHWQICCLNHIVDVVSVDAPEIRYAYVKQSSGFEGARGWSRPTE